MSNKGKGDKIIEVFYALYEDGYYTYFSEKEFIEDYVGYHQHEEIGDTEFEYLTKYSIDEKLFTKEIKDSIIEEDDDMENYLDFKSISNKTFASKKLQSEINRLLKKHNKSKKIISR